MITLNISVQNGRKMIKEKGFNLCVGIQKENNYNCAKMINSA